MEKKPSANSRTTKTAIVMPQDANNHDTLFGGKLMAHIDDVAAIAAMRHARQMVVTASTDSVDFLHPIKVGDSINVEGFVTSSHRTSMEVFVKVESEGLLTGKKKVCATALLTFVALRKDGKPTEVPPIYPETELEKMLFVGAEIRRERRNERKKESQKMAKLFENESNGG